MQRFLNREGSWREKRHPAAVITVGDEQDDDGNVASIYAADGTHLCDLGWRPWNSALAPEFLFLC